jgi:cytochrome d ubiquinol oxidase subunit II
MALTELWFVLFAIIVAGYLILDGFDMGVGILLVPLARTDIERRTFLNSIGPVWDGNEVWLVLAGGVLFAVFPLAYASLFSGLYTAFMLVLVAMIRSFFCSCCSQKNRRYLTGEDDAHRVNRSSVSSV